MNDPRNDGPDDGAVAVVGYTGRFAGADTPEELWRLLREGGEAAHVSTDEELLAAGVPAEALEDPSLVRRRPVLEGAELFDAAFFGYTPAEAASCDPQQRLFLEAAWQVMEHAGHDPRRFDGAVGVYAGGGPDTYLLSNVLPSLEGAGIMARFASALGNERDFIAPRVAYKLDLRGPAVTVLAGCATSLVAVHTATQSLLAGETDLAIAGGSTVYLPRYAGYFHQEGGVNSRDGRCRPFSAEADGTVHGDAVVAVALRRLSDALADGDRVHGVIRGSAVNNDGADKVGFTAPSVSGQAAVVSEALAVAGLDPADIDYVETHGTGTRLGDAIEVEALTRAFAGAPRGGCLLGALKPAIGHTDTAAGVAGLIKVLLAMEHGELPPVPGFTGPDPRIDFAATPFRVNDRLTPWPRRPDRPRRAGVSSFSVGGTNAHVVVEEPPPAPERAHRGSGPHLLVVSARTPGALSHSARNLSRALAGGAVGLADAARTLRRGRAEFEYRHAVAAADTAEASRLLAEAAERPGTRAAPGGDAVFLFPGQGSQFAGMGSALYAAEPVYAAAVDTCAEVLSPLLGRDPRDLLAASAAGDPGAEKDLARTRFTQPLLFTVEYAATRLLAHRGVHPVAMVGHSVGEYAAACAAGVFPLDAALAAVAERGRLIDAAPAGLMAAVALPEEQALEHTGGGVELAAVNSAGQCVLSGRADRLRPVLERLRARGVRVAELATSHAFHSGLLDGVVGPFAAHVAGLSPTAPRVPFASGVTGTWITPGQAADPAYWGRQLRAPVRFADGLAAVLAEYPDAVLVEVGPGTSLRAPAVAAGARGPVVPTLGRPEDARAPYAAERLRARLWSAGLPIEEDTAADREGRRVPLPTYPFQRSRHWIDPPGGPRPIAVPAYAARRMRGNGGGAPPEPGGAGPERHPRPHLGAEPVPPRDEVEQAVAEIWEDVMGVTHLGVHDDFYALGGDSLIAARVCVLVQERFPVEFGVGDLLADPPTIAGAARTVGARLLDRLEGLSDEEVRSLLSGGA